MDTDAKGKNYVIVVQCERTTRQTCPGFLCEWAFHERKDAFAGYPADVRYNAVSCGGCPGQAVLRKLMNVKHNLKKRQNATHEGVMVHLSSCITRSNHHGPRCPHIDYIKGQIARAGFDFVEDSRISQLSEKRREEGLYRD